MLPRMSSTVPATRSFRFARPDGAEIAVEITGEGPPIVFAHGLGGNHLSWFQQVADFSRRHACIAFSHRGFAPSTDPAGTPDPRLYAGDLIALLDHLSIPKAVIVGQSMGGWTAVETALAVPDRVAGIVLACTTGSFDYDGFGDDEVARWRGAAPKAIDALVARGIHRAAGARMAEENPALHGLYQAIDRMNHALDKNEIGNRIRAMRVRGPADAARIACPVLCITGEEDLLIAPRGVRLVADRMPNARVSVVPASGHSVYFERAAIFDALVARFLAEIGWNRPTP
jgi:3-oxoadipate enol-lactonase